MLAAKNIAVKLGFALLPVLFTFGAKAQTGDLDTLRVNVDNRKERKKIIHAREKELKREFTDKLTKLSVYQGKVLMKLINRQTGNNCYEIIEEYKGFMSAAFWQGVAFVFGSNLKQAYDASGKDRDMERIVRDVQLMYGHSE